jgi:hypothetical protein
MTFKMTFKPMRMLCVLAGILLFGPAHQGMSEGSGQSVEKASVNEKYKHAVEMLRADKTNRRPWRSRRWPASPHFAAAYSYWVSVTRDWADQNRRTRLSNRLYILIPVRRSLQQPGSELSDAVETRTAAEQFEQSIRLTG